MRLTSFLDADGRIVVWPARKRGPERAALRATLLSKFERGVVYSEPEVNAVLNAWHLFEDPAFLRRDLVDHGMLTRTRDGREYRVVEECPGRDSNPHGLAANGF